MKTTSLGILLIIRSIVFALEEFSIQTQIGTIKGIKRTVLENDLYEFRQIPYAKAPTRELRFEKPAPHEGWSGTLDATMFGPSCYQTLYNENILVNKNISEDCLHLNIQVPFTVTPSQPKSVMIWIHGGGFNWGQSQVYDAGRFAVTGDVIMVTINYRLNVFGFLSTGDIKGNYGLWDQIAAIKWVKQNIRQFGGNSDSITIFGESAGSFSVGLLSTIPSLKGLFHRAIMQSGEATSPVSTRDKLDSKVISSLIQCNTTLLRCLKDMPTEKLYMTLNPLYLRQAPVVDGELIPDIPLKLLQDPGSEASKFYRSLDIIIGTNTGEGSLLLARLNKEESTLNFNITQGLPRRVLTQYVAPMLSLLYYNNNSDVMKAMIGQYGNSNDLLGQSFDILDLFSDGLFHVPAIKSLQLHSGEDNGKQFQYLFHGRSPLPLLGDLPPWFNRSQHAADTTYQFENKFVELPSLDTELSRNLMKYWTNFAKTG